MVLFLPMASDNLAETDLVEVRGEQAIVPNIDGASCVRIDDAALVAAALRYLESVPPEPP
jgi:hypothetical protein